MSAHFHDLLLNIHKPTLLHQRLELPGHVKLLAEFTTRLVDQILPLGGTGRGEVFIAKQPAFVLLHLEQSAGLQVSTDLLEELSPVCDSADHASSVDNVEGLVFSIRPVALHVVNVELEVWWHPCWLNGAEICADDFCFGVLICEVDGPDAFAQC